MHLTDLAELARGRPTVKFRGGFFYVRPLGFALVVWLVLVACRFTDGPLPPELACVGLLGPLAGLSLCFKAAFRAPSAGQRPAPRLMGVVARLIVLLLALWWVQAAWLWLAPDHA